MSMHELALFVTGNTMQGERAIGNLKRICEQEMTGDYRLRIIDVLTDPWAAEEMRIIATPTLVKIKPLPLRRLIGDLSDKEMVITALDINLNR